MKVRAKSRYRFVAVGLDIYDPPHGVKAGTLADDQVVRVVNLRGCPRANTMGMCHIEDPGTGEFLGLVLCNSLSPEAR